MITFCFGKHSHHLDTFWNPEVWAFNAFIGKFASKPLNSKKGISDMWFRASSLFLCYYWNFLDNMTHIYSRNSKHMYIFFFKTIQTQFLHHIWPRYISQSENLGILTCKSKMSFSKRVCNSVKKLYCYYVISLEIK